MKKRIWPALLLLTLLPIGRSARAAVEDRPLAMEFRRIYGGIERAWSQKRASAVIALWAEDYTEAHPKQETRSREKAAGDLRANLGNRGSTWKRTHQILGVKLLAGNQQAEVWVRTRTRGVLLRGNHEILAGGPWTLSMGTRKDTLTQAASERHVWTRTPSGWRLTSVELRKVR